MTATRSQDLVAGLLRDSGELTLTTHDPSGWPHSAPVWFVTRHDGLIAVSTRGDSRRVRNLRADPRATALVAGGPAFTQLHGAMLRCRATIRDDPAAVSATIEEMLSRYAFRPGLQLMDPAMADVMRAQNPGRVSIELRVEDVITWDFRSSG